MKVGNRSIAGVVVLFHPKSTVINNIQSYIDDLDQLYVVDNSENKLRTYFSNFFEKTDKIDYIKNNENIGLASALNIGVNKAINDKYHFKKIFLFDTHYNIKYCILRHSMNINDI